MALRVLIPVLSVVLAGCAGTLPGRYSTQREVSRYALDGRFSLRQGERIVSGRISWTHAPGSDRVLIQDPFGSGIAELERSSAMTRLTLADGRVAEDADPEALMLRLTGLPLPVAGVGDWLTGRRRPEAGDAQHAETDALERTVGLERDGWRIRFDYAEDLADALPSRIFARRADELELRLSVERWEIAP